MSGKKEICVYVFGDDDFADLLGKEGSIPNACEVISAKTFSAFGVNRRTLQSWGEKGAKLVTVIVGQDELHPNIIGLAEELGMKIMVIPKPSSEEIIGVRIPVNPPVTCFNLPRASKPGMTGQDRLQFICSVIDVIHGGWHSYRHGVIQDFEII